MQPREFSRLTAACILLVTVGACGEDGGTLAGPEPTTSTDMDHPSTLHLEGLITSDADGSPVGGARILLTDDSLCDYWEIVFGGCSEDVAEATTDADGFVSMSYSPCSGALRVWVGAKGFRGPGPRRIECREGVQDISATLEYLPVTFLSASFSTQATVGEPIHMSYRVYAHEGLAWISADWSDGSAPQQIALSGREAEGKVFHAYATPGEYARRLTVTDSMGRTAHSGLRVGVTE